MKKPRYNAKLNFQNEERKKIMGKAIIAFILSVGVGTWLSFFNHGIGVVVSISIIGAFLIYQNENKKDE